MIRLKTRKRLGQHFLFDTNILQRIVSAADVCPDDTVIEIGPGLGTLTRQLAARAGKVIAIEIDPELVNQVKRSFTSTPNVEIVHEDALKFDYQSVGSAFKVVSNIPYSITTPLVFRLLECQPALQSMTLLVQKEVAERMAALPGGKDYGVLSIAIQTRTCPKIVFNVPNTAFRPVPQVDSSLVTFATTPHYLIKDYEFFMKVVRTAFLHRRKTLLNCLKSFPNVKTVLAQEQIDPVSRPERLSIDDFIRLSARLRNSFD
jgi:16S rRNA (adenine1518-N6/adenine1519-N6)-dimethyltransferase